MSAVSQRIDTRPDGRAGGRVGAAAGGDIPPAAHDIDSAEGIAPFAQWSDGVKGHFITRAPPEGFAPE